MPTQINVVFDNFNIQTWTKFLVSFKMYTWFTEKKHTKQTTTKNKKQKKQDKKIERTKYQKSPKIFMKVESKVEYL